MTDQTKKICDIHYKWNIHEMDMRERDRLIMEVIDEYAQQQINLSLGNVSVSVNDYQNLMDFCNSVAWAGERWKFSNEMEMISRARKILSVLDKKN